MSKVNSHALSLLAVLVVLGANVPARAQNQYKIDPVHSFVVFKVLHMNVGNAWGRFNSPEGTIVWDDQDPSKSSVAVTLQAAKIDTGNTKRDEHLKSADFFNARQFPTITFKSNSITKSGDNKYEVSGDMTMHGVTKPITATVTKVGEAETRAGYRAGFEAEFTLKRSDFGITFMPEGLGDEVQVIASFEGVRS